MQYQEILTRLCALNGPSGFEENVARAAAQLLAPYADEVYTNRLGSVIGVRRCGVEGAKKLLLDAHLDEIGFIITGVEEGFLRFSTIGGVDPRMLPDRELVILCEEPVHGVVTCLPPHIQSEKEQDQSIPVKELYIDVGMSQQQAERRIPIGTPAVYYGGCAPLGEGLLCGKALDDRACFASILGAAELLKDKALDVDLYFVGSTREEINCAGAITAAFGIALDYCVAVDVTHGATPDAAKEKTFPLGGGPAIGLGPNCTGWMAQRMFDKAAELGMAVQTEVMAGRTGTNGWPMQISREGVATAILSLPLRYMHSPIETINLKDLEDTAKLLAAFTENLGKEAHHA